MTHDELLEQLKQTLVLEEMEQSVNFGEYSINQHAWKTLIAIVEMHKPETENPRCIKCGEGFPCSEIEVIREGLE